MLAIELLNYRVEHWWVFAFRWQQGDHKDNALLSGTANSNRKDGALDSEELQRSLAAQVCHLKSEREGKRQLSCGEEFRARLVPARREINLPC